MSTQFVSLFKLIQSESGRSLPYREKMERRKEREREKWELLTGSLPPETLPDSRIKESISARINRHPTGTNKKFRAAEAATLPPLQEYESLTYYRLISF